MIYADLDAFYLEHRRCGELDGGVDDERVWMTCECGVAMWPTLTTPASSATITAEVPVC